jgi:hypothetical protein
MKLVITYYVDVEWVAGGEMVIPVEYESEEKFICDFEDFSRDHQNILQRDGFLGL